MDWSAWLKVGEVILGGAVGGTPAVSSEKQISIRGLNRNHNHDLKNLFKSAATIAAYEGRTVPGVLRCSGRQGEQAGDGASDPRAQDRRDHLGGLEEGSPLRYDVACSANQ